MIQKITLSIALGAMAYQDWKEKMVSVCMVGILAGAGVLFSILFPERNWQDILAGCGVGAGMLMISGIMRGSVGSGDALILMATGIFLGFWENLQLLFTALLLVAAAAAALLVTKKKGRKDSMPFVPFLFLAYLLQLIC